MAELNHLSLGQQLGELTQAIRDLTVRVTSLEAGMKNTNTIFTLGRGTAIGVMFALALMFNGVIDVIGKIWTVIK